MARGIEIKIKGVEALQKKLAKLSEQLPKQTVIAIREEAELIMTEAKRRTPVLTGALRASGHVVEKPDGAGLAFGGPAAPYAVYVHENLEAFHRVGQAKFLESAVNEAVPGMAERIAKRLAALIKG